MKLLLLCFAESVCVCPYMCMKIIFLSLKVTFSWHARQKMHITYIFRTLIWCYELSKKINFYLYKFFIEIYTLEPNYFWNNIQIFKISISFITKKFNNHSIDFYPCLAGANLIIQCFDRQYLFWLKKKRYWWNKTFYN